MKTGIRGLTTRKEFHLKDCTVINKKVKQIRIMDTMKQSRKLKSVYTNERSP